ncbi:MAG TPA: hypothetical protein VL401_00535 [Alphaproteobacteria bacterium]|nr:hypothetical protein [Alphaproteobacteria bacterium]
MILMNKVILQKFAIYALALGGGIMLGLAFESGETKDYIYAFASLIPGLFYVFVEAGK